MSTTGRPLRLNVCGRTYAVDWDSRPETELATGSFAGRSNHDKGFIAINCQGVLSDDAERDTLLHEVLHVVMGLNELPDEEKTVVLLATHLLDTLRRNPHLVTYLMEGV